MSVDEGLLAWVQDALELLGSVSMRKTMGGATLYLDGTIFAILAGAVFACLTLIVLWYVRQLRKVMR